MWLITFVILCFRGSILFNYLRSEPADRGKTHMLYKRGDIHGMPRNWCTRPALALPTHHVNAAYFYAISNVFVSVVPFVFVICYWLLIIWYLLMESPITINQ
jgi:hypothetical protein